MYLIISRNTKIKRKTNTVYENIVETPVKCYQEYKRAKESLLSIVSESAFEFKYKGNRFWSNYTNKTDSVKDNCKYVCKFKNGGSKEYYIKYIKLS